MRWQLYAAAIALLVAMAAGSLLILAFGQSPAAVYGAMLAATWGDAYGFGQVLFKATPLVFTGLAVALAFRAGLFNIGAEGQLTVGAFATALVGVALPGATPSAVAWTLAIGAGALAGAALAAIPGYLRARFGAHEVINTIMLNFIASALVLWLGNELFFAEGTTHTAAVVESARLPKLGLAGSAANVSVFLAVAAAAAVALFFSRSRRGFELEALGKSPLAAENAGVELGRGFITAMALSGALAGLVGANYVLGYKHYFEEGMGRGVGFMGIAVALLGRNSPAGVVFAALLFGTLDHGGLAVNQYVPKEIIEVLQAVIILAVACAAALTWRRQGRAA